MLGLKVPTESRRKSLSSFLLVPPTSHLSTLHANSEEARELGKHSQQGCRGGICRSDEKCVKPLADRIPASIPLVPHCSVGKEFTGLAGVLWDHTSAGQYFGRARMTGNNYDGYFYDGTYYDGIQHHGIIS